MWVTEQSVDTDATPQAIWRLWAEVAGWPEWNADIDRIELRGPFATGSTILMTPCGQEEVSLRIADTIPDELFIDEAEVAGTVIKTTHRIDRLADGHVRVVYRLEATGPLEEQLGPAISSDFPQTLQALVDHARD